MDKQELIEALRETGIVPKENDANGIRVLLTVNDYETLKSKSEKSIIENRLKLAQFWGIILTAICLIISTIWGVLSPKSKTVKLIPRTGYVLKITDSGNERYILPEVRDKRIILQLQDTTGLKACE